MGEKINLNRDRGAPFCDLHAALEKIEVFTQQDDAAEVHVEADKLVAKTPGALEKTSRFLGSIFSDQIRKEHEQRQSLVKQHVLQARDVIQAHIQLIHQWSQGGPEQQNLAAKALNIIDRFHAVIPQDKDLKNSAIRFPHTVSAKLDSDPNQSTQKIFKDLSEVFSVRKESVYSSPTHKKSEQVMNDTFRMKARRKAEEHLPPLLLDTVIGLIVDSPIDFYEDPATNSIKATQVLEIFPGCMLVIAGSFSMKLMGFPILENLQLTMESVQNGFPAFGPIFLSEGLLNANLLRPELAPQFSQLEQRKKELAKQLIDDEAMLAGAARIFKADNEAFKANPEACIQVHRQFYESLFRYANVAVDLEPFYSEVASHPTPFQVLVNVQERLLDFAINVPFWKLQEAWLNGEAQLRQGTAQEKFEAAFEYLRAALESQLSTLDPSQPIEGFILKAGQVIGQAARSIHLQYMQEKAGFSPVELSDFEKWLQGCAFAQFEMFSGRLSKDTNEFRWEESVPPFEEGIRHSLVVEIESYFKVRSQSAA